MSTRNYRKKTNSICFKNTRPKASQSSVELTIPVNILSVNILSVTRRVFMTGLGASLPILSACSNLLKKTELNKNSSLSSEQWQTIDAIYQHLLPIQGEGPSSKEANATEYLFNNFASPKVSSYHKKIINSGQDLVNSTSLKLYSKKFLLLSDSEKEYALRDLEKTEKGEEFLALLMDYLFEALLGDPVYGCQPKFSGWQWLEHIPGFPRPSKPDPRAI